MTAQRLEQDIRFCDVGGARVAYATGGRGPTPALVARRRADPAIPFAQGRERELEVLRLVADRLSDAEIHGG